MVPCLYLLVHGGYMSVPGGHLRFLVVILYIHSKSWIRWIQKSADDFEFSAERLSENAKSIKITLFAELLTVISPIYVQSLQ